MDKSFVHLNVRSEYSLLESSCRIEELTARAKALGQKALALCDKDSLFGAVKFYKAAVAAGIRPIIGSSLTLAGRDADRAEFILLCKDNQGYSNLVKIVSAIKYDLGIKKKCVGEEVLKAHSEGLLCIAENAVDLHRLLSLAAVFGAENTFAEISAPGSRENNFRIQELARRAGIRAVVTNKVCFCRAEDFETYKMIRSIEDGGYRAGEENYLKSAEEMYSSFQGFEAELEVSEKIANSCKVSFDLEVKHLPVYISDTGISNSELFRKLCLEGLEKKYSSTERKAALERFEYEAGVISSMGYIDYFLIVWDFVSYAKKNNIPVGPGRGSGGGCLCAYLLDITEIEPLKHGLFFERFLNPERVSLPDLDIDFGVEGRQKVKEYVVKKYGRDRAAEVVTFDTLKVKGAVRETAAVTGLPDKKLVSILSLLSDKAQSINSELKTNARLSDLAKSDYQIRKTLDMAAGIENMPRYISTHASALVISPFSLTELVPLSDERELPAAMFAMDDLDALGLVKFDFLGLKNLSVIDFAVNSIRKREPDFDIKNIASDDRAVYEMLSLGKTDGVFQLESQGIRKVLRQVSPRSIDDLAAVLALYRPGPMDSIDSFAANKRQPERIRYRIDSLRPILSDSYGCIIYQEQVMQICRSLAGFSNGKADLVRRAMAKKDPEKMKEIRKMFLYGSPDDKNCVGTIAKGIDKKTSEELFDEMAGFAAYAFNKSHAVCYALVSYRTAYLKKYYPADYCAALLNSFGTDKRKYYLEAYTGEGLCCKVADINSMPSDFESDGRDLVFGIASVRGVSRAFAELIIEEREKRGSFATFDDFCRRTVSKTINRAALVNLVHAGALDCFGLPRKQMADIIENNYSAYADDLSMEGQLSFFGEEEEVITRPEGGEYPENILEKKQEEVLGIKKTDTALKNYFWLRDIMELKTKEGDFAIIGEIRSVKTFRARNGSDFYVAQVSSLNGGGESISFFSEVYRSCARLIREKAVCCIKGSIRKGRMTASLITGADSLVNELEVYVRVSTREEIEAVRNIARGSEGRNKLIFYLENSKKVIRYKDESASLDLSEAGLERICKIVNKKCVKAVKHFM